MGAFLLGLLALGVLRSIVVTPTTGRRIFLAFVLVLLLIGVGLLGWLAVLGEAGDREAARWSQCRNNLKQIGLALRDYHDTYGCFPPAYVADEEGRPMYSWRVLLLPFLEQKPLYEKFRFDEPWNSRHNQALLKDLQYSCYRCPSDRESEPTETNYVMIVGPSTITDGPSGRKISEISDGTSNTIAVVEVTGLGIQWTEPRDLKADEISFGINDPGRPGIGSHHFRDGVNALLADGYVEFVSTKNPPELIRAMTTIDGGEDVSALNDF